MSFNESEIQDTAISLVKASELAFNYLQQHIYLKRNLRA